MAADPAVSGAGDEVEFLEAVELWAGRIDLHHSLAAATQGDRYFLPAHHREAAHVADAEAAIGRGTRRTDGLHRADRRGGDGRTAAIGADRACR